jgi:cobalt-zinc-cadmium efflux system outer membrane protein
MITERFRLLTDVRQNYWEVVTLQRRAEVLEELITLAEKTVENAEKLLKAKVGSELDVVQLEVDRERYKAEYEATKRALPAAFRRLAASTGVYQLPETKLRGDLETPLTNYDLQRVKAYVLGIHPEMRSAQLGVERAQLVIQRAEVEPIPNVTVSAGYVRQNQNRSDDWVIGVSLPVPVWNRNQGNIFAARAQLGESLNEAARIQNELVGRIASAFTNYGEARARAEKYKSSIIPKAERSLELAQKAYQGGQFEYLRVLQSQRAIAEARLEYIRSLGDMWRAASSIAGLMLEDQWPNIPLQK